MDIPKMPKPEITRWKRFENWVDSLPRFPASMVIAATLMIAIGLVAGLSILLGLFLFKLAGGVGLIIAIIFFMVTFFIYQVLGAS
jgi:hypothetical protein